MADLQQLPDAGQKVGAEPALRVRLGGEEPEVVPQVLGHVAQTPFLRRDRADGGDLLQSAQRSGPRWQRVGTP